MPVYSGLAEKRSNDESRGLTSIRPRHLDINQIKPRVLMTDPKALKVPLNITPNLGLHQTT
jgi:hypothetical protein